MRTNKNILPYETMIEVVATKGNMVVKREMSYAKALGMKKKAGWFYRNFQIGFCSMKSTE